MPLTGLREADLPRRPATAREARALANPLRLRILRLCLDEARTNRSLADHLGVNPGTSLHHVRMLLDTGFLEVEEERRGARGSREKLLRATGKSWRLDVGDEAAANDLPLAVIDAVREEFREAGSGAQINGFRLGVRLGADAIAELSARIDALAAEYSERDDPDGEPVAIYALVHRRRREGRARRNG